MEKQCYAGLLAGTGLVALTASQHKNWTNVPVSCVAGSLFGVGVLATAAVHHGGLHHVPQTQCWIGSVAIAAGLAAAARWHSDAEKKVPLSCIAGAAVGTALIIAGAAKLSK